RRGAISAARAVAGGLLGRHAINDALGNAATALGLKRHPQDNLDEVIALDRRLTDRFPPERCRSVFFFMAGGRSQYDGYYSIRDKHPRSRLREVMESGAEIGLHASYEAGANPSQLAAEREELEIVSGGKIEKNRHHFLAWREPEHGQTIAEAGIRWDATLGYAELSGFRLGVCRPVRLFDPVHRRPLDIEEHPLTVMDCTLDRPNYMNLGEEEAFEQVRKLIDETYRHRGEFVCLWHNTVLASDDKSFHKQLYVRVLDYLGSLLEKDQCGL
ncbi:MAG: polysaccharide deacetylase family protein, partial [Pirellulales bacterium]|nr:polysaccharide deacetylase family protein [Pirellulales bacterium]